MVPIIIGVFVFLMSTTDTVFSDGVYKKSEGDDVEFECPFSLFTNVSWKKKDSEKYRIIYFFNNRTQEIYSELKDRAKLSFLEDKSILKISSLIFDDEGIYTCGESDTDKHINLQIATKADTWKDFVGTVVGAVVATVVIVGVISYLVWRNRTIIRKNVIHRRPGLKKPKPKISVTQAESSNRLNDNKEYFHITPARSFEIKLNDPDLEMEPLTNVNVFDAEYNTFNLSNDWSCPESMSVQIQEVINHGFFGEIFSARLKLNDNVEESEVAVQYFNISEKNRFAREIEIRKKLPSHINVIEMIGYFWERDAEKFGLVTEFSPYGTLKEYISSEETTFNGKDLLKNAHQISKGMAHIESYNIIIRDLTAANVVMGAHRICKIAYFELARDLGETDEYTMDLNDPVPVRWLPPESLFENSFTIHTDVWSYGIVLWEIVTLGMCPYPDLESPLQVFEFLKEKKRMPCPRHCNPEIYDIMLRCWEENPKHRPTFQQITDDINLILIGQSEYLNINDVDKPNCSNVNPKIYRHVMSEFQ